MTYSYTACVPFPVPVLIFPFRPFHCCFSLSNGCPTTQMEHGTIEMPFFLLAWRGGAAASSCQKVARPWPLRLGPFLVWRASEQGVGSFRDHGARSECGPGQRQPTSSLLQECQVQVWTLIANSRFMKNHTLLSVRPSEVLQVQRGAPLLSPTLLF